MAFIDFCMEVCDNIDEYDSFTVMGYILLL